MACNPCADQCKPKCAEPKCCKPCCAEDNCDRYSAFEIGCKLRAAVVDVTGILVLSDEANVMPNDVSGTNVATYKVSGNGAFICKHLILTSASLVQAPPTAMIGNYRVPAVSSNDTDLTTGIQPSPVEMPVEIVRMSKILVTVHNLNGRRTPAKHGNKCGSVCTSGCNGQHGDDGHSFSYEATVLFIDGAAGFALLFIDPCNEANRCMPPIRDCHPFFEIANSRKLRVGDDIYLLGANESHRNSPNVHNGMGIYAGVVSNERGADHSGGFLPELLKVDVDAYFASVGMPMVDKFGRLVGLQLGSTPGAYGSPHDVPSRTGPITGYGTDDRVYGQGSVFGVTSNFMEFGIKAVLSLKKNSSKYDCLKQHLGNVSDSLGNYFKFLKGWVGVCYDLFHAEDYVMWTVDQASGRRQILLNSSANALYDGPVRKEIRGIRVDDVAGLRAANATWAFCPGASTTAAPFNTSLVNRPLFDSNFASGAGALAPDDVLITVEGCVIGDESRQVLPSLLTWRLLPKDVITFEVLRHSYTAAGVANDNNLRDVLGISAALLDFPAHMDYPWVLIDNFPLVTLPIPAPLVSPASSVYGTRPTGTMLPEVTYHVAV